MAGQRLGQHFLADAGWRERIAREVLGLAFDAGSSPGAAAREAGNDPAGVPWIEIGAGHGEMTVLLAPQVNHVTAIELDSSLTARLRKATAHLKNVAVVPGDVLALDLAALVDGIECITGSSGIAGEIASPGRFRVYGNLPYYITSPIVHRLFEHADRLEAAFLVVQLEVAERMAARPGSRDYGYFSAFARFYARPEILLRIPPAAFQPPPKVESALVALHTPGERARLGIGDERGFLDFLKICFAHKRKTLRNNLRVLMPAKEIEDILGGAGFASDRLDARAEQLMLSDFARLFVACAARARR